MKNIGILSFFPAFNPPRSGGELRLHHIAMELVKRGFNIEMASPTFGDARQETIQHIPGFTERRFPRTKVYNAGHRFMDRWAKFSECSGLVCSLVATRHEELRREADRLAQSADILTHESPFLAQLGRRRRAGQLLVYNSYNVEARMAHDMFGRRPAGRLATAWITRLERHLLAESDIVLACSDEDGAAFVRDHGLDATKLVVVPNGVDVGAIVPAPDAGTRAAARRALAASSRPVCFFIGSFHPPNIDAARMILREVAPQLPGADFLIAGKVCEALANDHVPANARLMGLIPDAQRIALLQGADVALNPMLGGSGTNLKMLDYLAAALPTVTTSHGARGLSLEPGKHALIADGPRFAVAVEELLSDSTLRGELGTSARRHAVDNFSWSAIGDKLAEVYSLKAGRRIIILNDYAVSPVKSGGQARIDAVARTLASDQCKVTVLTMTGDKVGRRLRLGPHAEELNVPRGIWHRQADRVLARLASAPADDVSALLLTRWLSRDFRRAIQRETRSAEAVILSHPYLVKQVLRPAPKRLFYDAHNCETELKQSLFKGFLARWLVARVRNAEELALRRAEKTFAVSPEVGASLGRMVPEAATRIILAPNGVWTSGRRQLDGASRRAIRCQIGITREFAAVFLGSGHPPNVEAAHLVVAMAKDFPRVNFMLIGGVCRPFWQEPLPGNVLLMESVEEDVKNLLLSLGDVALNPMLSGNGTSLKLFDYMASHLCVLSTEIGARGLAPNVRECIVVPHEFQAELRSLLADAPRRVELGTAAGHVAETNCDWLVTLTPLRAQIGA